MLVGAAHYETGACTAEGLTLDAALDLHRRDGGFVWLSFVDPGPEELRGLADTFGLHELACADILSLHECPKFECYDDDVYLVILRTAYYGDDHRAHFGELAVFLGDTFVVTARKRGPHSQRSARATLLERGDLLAHGVSAVQPMLGPLDAIQHGAYGRLEPMRPYLRDVGDDAKLLYEDIVRQRDRLTAVLEASLALITYRQNQSIRKVSGWAAILAVPTLIAGVFGMNFSKLPGQSWGDGFWICVGVMLVAAGSVYLSLKRARWM
jgi:magnesium transporter